jgi:hypothetical protein
MHSKGKLTALDSSLSMTDPFPAYWSYQSAIQRIREGWQAEFNCGSSFNLIPRRLRSSFNKQTQVQRDSALFSFLNIDLCKV